MAGKKNIIRTSKNVAKVAGKRLSSKASGKKEKEVDAEALENRKANTSRKRKK